MSSPETAENADVPAQAPLLSARQLWLVPAPLSQQSPAVDLLPADLPVVRQIVHWLVETPKAARAWLKLYGHPIPIAQLDIKAMADFTDSALLRDWMKGLDGPVGVMSDAGCPGVADPGALAVAQAHAMGWTVCPMVGPSSILLALMASGLSGQSFTFNGYLPVENTQRQRFLQESERQSARLKQTQIAIETPYRNAALFQALCDTLKPDTLVCVASELRGPVQSIATRTVSVWKKQPPALGKQATLFLWQAQG